MSENRTDVFKRNDAVVFLMRYKTYDEVNYGRVVAVLENGIYIKTTFGSFVALTNDRIDERYGFSVVKIGEYRRFLWFFWLFFESEIQ